jgi:hypothetical protein
LSQAHAIWSREDRQRLAVVILDPSRVPDGTRLTFSGAKRTSAQNARFHAMIGEVAKQATHNGTRYSADQWKAIFLHALGQEIQFLPSLDGRSFFPIGMHSSEFSKDQMSDAIELVFAWGTEHGVKFREPREEPPPHGMVIEPPKRRLEAPTIEHREHEFERPEF